MDHASNYTGKRGGDSSLWPIAVAVLTVIGATAAAFVLLLGPVNAVEAALASGRFATAPYAADYVVSRTAD